MLQAISLVESPLHQQDSISKGLILIPDFSGFTEFVMNQPMERGRYITQQLLNTLMHNNILDLEISEVEGDAILFYKFGMAPRFSEIMKQAKQMEAAFVECIHRLEQELTTAINLSLKFIVHYGEFCEYQVGNFTKLYGNTVVEAHQLLKYRYVKHLPYILFTQSYLHSINDNEHTTVEPEKSPSSPPVGFIHYLK